MHRDPVLPQNDTRPTERARQLSRAQAQYTFHIDDNGVVAAGELPLSARSDPRWYAGLTKRIAELEVNKLAMHTPAENLESLAETVRSKLADLVPGERADDRHKAMRGQTTERTGIDCYSDLYQTIAAPDIVNHWSSDEVFAWQAVAGINPIMLQRLTRGLDHFPVTEAHYARAIGAGDTLAKAMAEGRLYLADYVAFDGAPPGTTDGRQKVNYAPLALYASTPGGLRPVAIQCQQRPGADNPIFTPDQGLSWKMARSAVAAGEGNYQGVISHFAMCHQIMESVILAAQRQLAENHPLLILMAPHFENTLLTNYVSVGSLIAPDGNMDRLQTPTLEGSLAIATDHIDRFRLTASAPRLDFAARGVDDLEALPDYPARDDALTLWDAMQPWFEGYVRLYYHADADVTGDHELAAWVTEMGSSSAGKLNGIDRPQTVQDVIDLVSQILFRCTVHHAQFNYTSFPLFSYPPNASTGAFGPGPTGDPKVDTEERWAAMLPPFDLAVEALTLFYELTMQMSKLGAYPRDHFRDERVAPLLQAHQASLAEAERVIDARNASRLLAYPYMKPSRVPLSIHV